MTKLRKIELGVLVTIVLAIITFSFFIGGLSKSVDELKAGTAIKMETEKALTTIRTSGGGVPVGTIIWMAAVWSDEEAKQHGYLIANGRFVSVASYKALHDAIKNTYGEDATAATFRLPDLRGLFIRGYDPDRIQDPDGKKRRFGSFQPDAIISHSHPVQIGRWHGAEGRFAMSGNSDGTQNTLPSDDGKETETRPKNICLLPLIRF
jgi:microcystin-dependent protein